MDKKRRKDDPIEREKGKRRKSEKLIKFRVWRKIIIYIMITCYYSDRDRTIVINFKIFLLIFILLIFYFLL